MQTTAVQTSSRTNRPLLRFVVLLAGLFGLFNVAFYGWIAESAWFSKYLALNASASAPVVRLFESDALANGISVRSSRFSLEIKHGCDALQPTAFFVFAMLSSPVPISLLRRIMPILIGTAALLALNIVRIVSLFYCGLKFPTLFETLHLDIWQAVFIFLPLVFWIGWALRATRRPSENANASP